MFKLRIYALWHRALKKGMVTKMKKTYAYETEGTCSRAIFLTVEDDILLSVSFSGGCSGNTQGVAKLAAGQSLEELQKKLGGIRCGVKPTSCPDQLARAIGMIREQKLGGRLKEVDESLL